jgi:hypothetical protein
MKSATAPLIAALLLAATAPSALGRPSVLATEHTGPFAWRITAHPDATVKPPRRGFCVDFGARFPGSRRGLGGEACFGSGEEHRHGNRGVISAEVGVGRKTAGVLAIFEVVDPRAASAVITLRSGQVLRAPTHALPGRLHAGARLAWVVEGVPARSLTGPGIDVSGVIAFDRGDHVVGRFAASVRAARAAARRDPRTSEPFEHGDPVLADQAGDRLARVE